MIVVGVNGFEKSFGADELFSDVSFSVESGDKIGLVGPNGCGKSTLFRLLVGEEPADGGQVHLGKDVKIAYMQQSGEFSGSVYEECLSCFSDLLKLEEEIDAVNRELEVCHNDALLERQHSLQERYFREGGAEFRSRIRGVLTGLGF